MKSKAPGSVLFLTLWFLLCLSGSWVKAQSVPGAPPWGSNYQLVWSQDFTTMSSLSVSAAGPCGAGGTTWMATKPGGGNWFDFVAPTGNLTPFGVGNGYLDIRVQQNGDPNNGFNGYTGGLLSSVDNNGTGFSQQYGYFECCMWVPGTPNTWPAFWLLNTSCLNNPKPAYTAEIDVMESYGNWGTGPNQNPPGDPNIDTVTWHQWGENGNPTTSDGTYFSKPGMSTGYHTYGVDIEPTTTTWYFDRTAIWSAPTLAMAKTPMFLMVNLALGGGSYNNSTNTGYNWNLTPNPTDLKIQYIAVYASPNSPNYVPGGTAPSITSSTVASVMEGSAFSYTITASNSPTSFSATGLPAGLSINTTTGVISGTPTTPGTYSVSLGATNASGTGTATLTLTVSGSGGSGSQSYAVQFGPSGTAHYTGTLFNGATAVYALNSSNGSVFNLGNGPGSDAPKLTFNAGILGNYDLGGETGGSTDISYLNSAYFYGGGGSTAPETLTVSGVAATDSVNLKFIQAKQVPGTAVIITPAGGSAEGPINIDSDTAWTDAGTFSGATSYQITVVGTSPYGWNAQIAGAFITVTSGNSNAPAITSTTTAAATTGSAFSYAITASNSPTSFSATGLPSGLSINTSTGVISGTPTTAGTYSVTLGATNASGTGTTTLTLTVSGSSGTGSQSYAVQFGPSSTAHYTGALFNGATAVYALGSSNGSVFNLGSGPGSDAPKLTFNAGMQGNYDLGGETGGSTDISYLNSSYFYGGGGTSTPVTFTVSGVSATDSVDFKFIQANQVPGTAVTVTPAGGSASSLVNINSTTAWTDAGTFTGATSYLVTVTGTSPYGWNAEIAGTYITVTSGTSDAPSITSSTTASATSGSAFSYAITATNSPTSFNATGLPTGLSINTSTGVISGTATTQGSYSVALSATNASGTGTTTLTLTVSGSSGGTGQSYAVQFGPSGTPHYTGALFNGATAVYALGSSNGSVFSLGSGPGSDSPAITFNAGMQGNYDLGGQTGSSTDISYLNSSYFYGGGGSSTPVTFTVSGVAATDSVDLKFIQAYQVPGTAVTVTPAGGSASNLVNINSDSSWTDAGTFSGATSYLITVTGTNSFGWNAEIAGALVTVTPH